MQGALGKHTGVICKEAAKKNGLGAAVPFLTRPNQAMRPSLRYTRGGEGHALEEEHAEFVEPSACGLLAAILPAWRSFAL